MTDGENAETPHEMHAEAFVPLRAEFTDYGLEATQEMDLDIQRWVCSCGESWDESERESAESHLREVTTDAE